MKLPRVDAFSILILVVALNVIDLLGIQHNAEAHFFGTTKDIDNYQVIFAPYPSNPIPGSNSTFLNFSILQNGSNIFNVYAALVITEKESGTVVAQLPYRLYEFSDISIPSVFRKTGDYVVTLQARITDDEKYRASPLVASFDLSVYEKDQSIPFNELMFFYVAPAAAAISGIVIYLRSKKMI